MQYGSVPRRRPVRAWNSVPNQVLLLCLMYILSYVDRMNISTAAALIKSDLGLSNTALGFPFSAFAYPNAFFQLIGGWLGDKFGPRLTLGILGLVVCISTTLTGAVGGLGRWSSSGWPSALARARRFRLRYAPWQPGYHPGSAALPIHSRGPAMH